MKKLYLFGFSLLASGMISAQVQNLAVKSSDQVQQLKTTNDIHPGTNVIYESRAAGDVIWSSDFSTASDWTAAGPAADYNINGWSIGTSVAGWYFGTTGGMGTSGNFARFINGNPSGTPPLVANGPFTLTYNTVIDLTGIPAPQLSFEQYGARFFTVQAVEVSTNGGTSWIQVGNNTDIPPLTNVGGSEYDMPMTRSFNISAAIAGDPSNVMIRLFWDGAMNGSSMNYIEYGWFVDNVRITEGYSYDSDIQAAYFRSGLGIYSDAGLEYYMVPLTQITPITFSGITINQGALIHTGLHLETNVVKGTNVFNGTSANANILPNAVDSTAVTSTFTPASGTGTYQINWEFAGTNAEGVTGNDIIDDEFEVTDYTYARDNGTQTGVISNVGGNSDLPMLIGNVMDIFATGKIGAVNIKISTAATNTGQPIYAQINYWDGSAWSYLGNTEDYYIQSSDLGDWLTLTFDNALDVTAGQSIIVMAGHYGSADEVQFGMAQDTDEQTVLGYTDGATDAFSLLTPQAIMIRLDMRDFAGVEEVTTHTFTVGQNVPNPFENTSVITYSLTEEANVAIQFVDVTGKVVKTVAPGTQIAGTYTIAIDGNELAEGVYFYTFTIGDKKVTKQMVVTK